MNAGIIVSALVLVKMDLDYFRLIFNVKKRTAVWKGHSKISVTGLANPPAPNAVAGERSALAASRYCAPHREQAIRGIWVLGHGSFGLSVGTRSRLHKTRCASRPAARRDRETFASVQVRPVTRLTASMSSPASNGLRTHAANCLSVLDGRPTALPVMSTTGSAPR